MTTDQHNKCLVARRASRSPGAGRDTLGFAATRYASNAPAGISISLGLHPVIPVPAPRLPDYTLTYGFWRRSGASTEEFCFTGSRVNFILSASTAPSTHISQQQRMRTWKRTTTLPSVPPPSPAPNFPPRSSCPELWRETPADFLAAGRQTPATNRNAAWLTVHGVAEAPLRGANVLTPYIDFPRAGFRHAKFLPPAGNPGNDHNAAWPVLHEAPLRGAVVSTLYISFPRTMFQRRFFSPPASKHGCGAHHMRLHPSVLIVGSTWRRRATAPTAQVSFVVVLTMLFQYRFFGRRQAKSPAQVTCAPPTSPRRPIAVRRAGFSANPGLEIQDLRVPPPIRRTRHREAPKVKF
ncbi:hypothetical protein DFH06DRAFT_1423117 [Mycena polygramma]|nr:hypothetical protein DFH06DRAFT_1423117 [Mycena polygramma]